MKLRTVHATGLALFALSLGSPAFGLPGFFAGKGKVPTSDSTHVVLMKKDDTTVVSVMPDYSGDIKPFAFVMPVPDDVTLEDIKTLRRDFVDRVDQISAPRFHEFWEMDPCEAGTPQQIWEQDLSARSDSDFLGAMPGADKPTRKIAKELQLQVDPQFKEGEHTLHLLKAGSGAEDVVSWLSQKGYTAPEGARSAIDKYVKAGMSLIVAEVDDKKIELVGGSRAILSPIRYATKKPVKVPSTLGLMNSDGKQELFLYVIHPSARYETKNYETVHPPTNIEVDFKVKERMGEFYAGLHDLILQKNPTRFLVEYAWHSSGCGQPCPNEPLLIHELLSLGADVFERDVPEEERLPDPPELSDEEKKAFEELKDKAEKKKIEDERKETERRKALLSRHKYVITRLHHRYDAAGLPHDVELGPAPHVTGGVEIPKGLSPALSTEVTTSAASKLQTRYAFYHPNKAVLHCDNPERGRWGKPPPTYRGLRKIWVAQDTAIKNRTSIKPAEMVKTKVESLGLMGAEVAVAAADAGESASAKAGASKCGCIVGKRALPGFFESLVALGAVLGLLRGDRRRSTRVRPPLR